MYLRLWFFRLYIDLPTFWAFMPSFMRMPLFMLIQKLLRQYIPLYIYTHTRIQKYA